MGQPVPSFNEVDQMKTHKQLKDILEDYIDKRVQVGFKKWKAKAYNPETGLYIPIDKR
jgi:hypothetical protein